VDLEIVVSVKAWLNQEPQRYGPTKSIVSMFKKTFTVVTLLATVLGLALPTAAQRRGRRMMQVDLLVLNGTLVTMDKDRRVIDDAGVAIKDGRIVAVDTSREIARSYSAPQTVDAANKIIIPGLINGHTHVPMTLFRGLADDLDLQDWLTKFIFPAEAKNVSEEFVRAGTRLGLAEMIRGGTTTYCDMYYFEDAIADETSKAGVRGVLGETVIDFPVTDNKTNAEAMA
jgi:5-methylthioadenosine/S-adenosylhomocysteine deaminase